MSDKALVIFSGGQDSTTCLYWAMKEFGPNNVEAVTFDYGQKHKIELDSARKICEMANIEFDLVEFPNILRSSSPLVNNSEDLEKHDDITEFPKGVQPTFVPGRNILFLTVAGNIALAKGCNKLVTGICEADFGGYYDCREDFVTSMTTTLNQGLFGKNIGMEILTPLMKMDKRSTVRLAKDLGKDCLDALAHSHTCYDGVYPPCEECHSCHLRARGFLEAGVNDPLIMRAKKETEANEDSSKETSKQPFVGSSESSKTNI